MEPREHAALMADLEHPDEEVRRLAVERLSMLPSGEGVPALVDCLGDPSWRVRKSAVERLASLRDASAAARGLIAALADGENPGRRNAALEALVRCGPAAVEPLLESVRDPDVDVRKQVVDALAGIGDERSAPALVELLEDGDPNVRGAVAEALGSIGGRRCKAPLLVAARSDSEPLVRLSALRALARLEVVVDVESVASLADKSLTRPGLYALLGFSEDPAALEILLKGLQSGPRSAREAAMEAWVRQSGSAEPDALPAMMVRLGEAVAADPEFLPATTARLADAPLATRLVIVQFLGLLGDPCAALPLVRAGADEAATEVVHGALLAIGDPVETEFECAFAGLPETSRSLACRVLGSTGGEVGERLLRMALNDESIAVASAAATSLGRRGSRACLRDLVELLVEIDRDDEVLDSGDRLDLSALEALVAVCRRVPEASQEALELAEQQLPAAAESFRVAFAALCGQLGAESDVARLELMLRDPSARVRRAAVESLAKLSPAAHESLRPALADESPQVRIGAAAVLARGGGVAAAEDLARLVFDEDVRVRAAAMRAFGTWARSAQPDAMPRALESLERGLTQGGAVALAALESLQGVGGPEAATLAKACLSATEPELVRAAVACISEHADVETVHELVALFAHPDWTVRAEVVQALIDRRVMRAVPAILRALEAERDEFVRQSMMASLRTLES